MKKILFLLLFAFHFSFFTHLTAQTGTWTAVKTLAPHLNYGVCLLMTDGTVICHNQHGGRYGTGWDRLTPDIHGSYANGTWDTIASMHGDRLFFSTQVLPDGSVYVAGGEYGAGDSAGEVYNPFTNTWTLITGLPTGWKIYDGNSEILYNGTILEGPQIGANPSFDCLFYTPGANLFTVAPTAHYNHDEASWLKLPDSSVLFVGVGSTYSNRYIPQKNEWIYDDTVPVQLFDYYGYEAGGSFMLPNGKAIFFGATPANALYTPTGDTVPGTWSQADSFPVINGTETGMTDASSAMMVNGKILCSVSPVGTSGADEFRTPAYFLEYDYTTNTFTQVTDTLPVLGVDSLKGICSYMTQMLDLPDGTVLVSISQTSHSNQYYIYTPGSGPIPQGKPTIDNLTDIHCNSYRITGKLFNGISEGASYGDDWQMETNYPLVRLTNGDTVYYARTSNWNRIGAVQTDSLEDTAYFMLPSIAGGTYSLQVVVNGFASNPVMLTTFGVVITSRTNITPCNTSNGSAVAFASTGVSPYTYTWSPSGGTGTSASNLSAGIYTITVTANDGCTTSASVDITQAGPVTVYTRTRKESCIGVSNGEATAIPGGGTSPYSYLWAGGATTATINGLSTGTYSVTVTDSCGNSGTALATIRQPDTLGVTIDTVINLLCYGDYSGSVSISVSGGTTPYVYSWSNGAGTNANPLGLSKGAYTVTVTDSCGNSATVRADVTQPEDLINTITTINCTSSGVCDGKATVYSSGGIAPYSYYWITGRQSTDSITGQCAGNYCCRVTDNNGCIQTVCVNIVTGIENIVSSTKQVTVYPNPNNGVFTLALSHAELVSGSKTIVEIYNMFGEKVYTSTLPPPNGGGASFTYQMNLSSQPNGVYFYRVLTEDGSFVGEGKIMIQK
jgi:Secretion system C-terminal sorting domain/SprB repeat/Galactose oxidase, central domain